MSFSQQLLSFFGDQILYLVLSSIYKNIRQSHPSRYYKTIQRFLHLPQSRWVLSSVLSGKNLSPSSSSRKSAVARRVARFLVGLLVLSGGGSVVFLKQKQIRKFIGLVAQALSYVLSKPVVLQVLMNPIIDALDAKMKEMVVKRGKNNEERIIPIKDRIGKGSNLSEDESESELSLSDEEPSNEEVVESLMNRIREYKDQQEKCIDDLRNINSNIKYFNPNNISLDGDLENINNHIEQLYDMICQVIQLEKRANGIHQYCIKELNQKIKESLGYVLEYTRPIHNTPIPEQAIEIIRTIKQYSILNDYEDEKKSDDIRTYLDSLQNISNGIRDDGVVSTCIHEILSLFLRWKIYYDEYLELRENNDLEPNLKEKHIDNVTTHIKQLNGVIRIIGEKLLNYNPITIMDLVNAYVSIQTYKMIQNNNMVDIWVKQIENIKDDIVRSVKTKVLQLLQNLSNKS